MAAELNRVSLIGNLTRDPQVRVLPNSNKVVAHFGLAVNHRSRSEDGVAREDTVFVDVTSWNRTAELVGQYLVKGSCCLVEGRLHMNTWDDRKTGERRSRIEVVAHTVQFLGRAAPAGGGPERGAAEAEPRQAAAPATPAAEPVAVGAAGDDEPPF